MLSAYTVPVLLLSPLSLATATKKILKNLFIHCTAIKDTLPSPRRNGVITTNYISRYYLRIMVDLSVTLGGVSLSSCVYNASGPRTGSSAAMSKIAKSASGGVLAKSATIASQKGNDLPR